MTTNERLHKIRNSLTPRLRRREIAALTGRSIKTVAAWLAKPGAVSYKNMPEHALELLVMKLEYGHSPINQGADHVGLSE